MKSVLNPSNPQGTPGHFGGVTLEQLWSVARSAQLSLSAALSEEIILHEPSSDGLLLPVLLLCCEN